MVGEGEKVLETIISGMISREGRITFADFMASCLYEPGVGYYTSPGRKVGAEGDFYTSSNVHQAFGRVIARELVRMWECLGSPPGFEMVEVGAGGGQLALDIMDSLRDSAPQLYAGCRYRFIEQEPSLCQVQAAKLFVHADRLAWSDPADLLGGRLSFTGCLLSNELVDSFPVHLVEMTGCGLREVYVVNTDQGFGEQLGEPSTADLQAYLDRTGACLVPGQRAEINLAAPAWLSAVAGSLERGFVLTIDYGYTSRELYSPGRMNGTLLCYYRHTIEENPYLRPGEQDITSHVDFTTLQLVGELSGLSTVWFGEQYRFLIGAGIIEELMALEASATREEEKIRYRLSLKKLMLPEGGMGDTFRVLVQSKGVAAPKLLCMRDWGSIL